jgi:hypothetical protein
MLTYADVMQGVTLLGDTMITCYHVQLKEYEPPQVIRMLTYADVC